MGHWQGTIFNNTKHETDFTFSFLEKFPFVKSSLWVSSKNNYSITDITDAYLGSIKIEEKSPDTIHLQYSSPNDSEYYILEINHEYKKEKRIDLHHVYITHGNQKMNASIYYSCKNIILTVQLDNFTHLTINAFHDMLPQIPMSQNIFLIICILVACFLGAIANLLFCYCNYGDQNYKNYTNINIQHEKLKQD